MTDPIFFFKTCWVNEPLHSPASRYKHVCEESFSVFLFCFYFEVFFAIIPLFLLKTLKHTRTGSPEYSDAFFVLYVALIWHKYYVSSITFSYQPLIVVDFRGVNCSLFYPMGIDYITVKKFLLTPLESTYSGRDVWRVQQIHYTCCPSSRKWLFSDIPHLSFNHGRVYDGLLCFCNNRFH